MKVLSKLKLVRKDKENGKTFYRNDWMEFHPRWGQLKFIVSPASYFDNRWYVTFCFFWGVFYIHLPIRSKYNESDPPQYGFYFYNVDYKKLLPDSLWLRMGVKYKCVDLPWSYDWVRTSMLRKDGEWEHETPGNIQNFFLEKWSSLKYCDVFSYTYILKSGKKQEVFATVKVQEREWRQKWLKWTSWNNRLQRTIDIEFDNEIGEETGSWKGGCTGCNYEMLPGETPIQTLRRMEKERKF